MTVQDVSQAEIRALEANLRALMERVISLRDYVQDNPNFTGDFKESKRFKAARKQWLATRSHANGLLRKKQTK